MTLQLLRALRTVHFVDSTAERELVFSQVAARSLTIRLVLGLYQCCNETPLANLMFAVYGAKSFFSLPFRRTSDNLLVIAEYGSEQRAVDDFLEQLETSVQFCSTIQRLSSLLSLVFAMLTHPKVVLRYCRCLKRIENRGNFLTTCRLASTLGYYLAAKHFLKRLKPKAIAIASNYNPASTAYAAAAERLGISVIFISHATIPRHPGTPPLRADLGVLYGPAAIDAFSLHGPFSCMNVVYKGLSGSSKALQLPEDYDFPLAVGVFLTGGTDEPRLRALLEALEKADFVRSILIRPHPLAIVNPDLDACCRGLAKVEIDRATLASETAAKCNLVIVGNSSVHLDVLKVGVATVFIDNFDQLPFDFYGFVRDKVTLELKTISELSLQLLCEFYDESWVERFRRYDAAYLEAAEERKSRLQAAVLDFFAGRSLPRNSRNPQPPPNHCHCMR